MWSGIENYAFARVKGVATSGSCSAARARRNALLCSTTMLLSTSALLAGLVAAPAVLAAASSSSPARSTRPPNVVFIIVDDQDARQESIKTMKSVQSLLVKEGTEFSRFYAPSECLLTVGRCAPTLELESEPARAAEQEQNHEGLT